MNQFYESCNNKNLLLQVTINIKIDNSYILSLNK